MGLELTLSWLCHMTHEVARARGVVTGKLHGESQPALGGCLELLTGDFPFCFIVAVPLEEEEDIKGQLLCMGLDYAQQAM